MIRVKIIKDTKAYKAGETVFVTRNEAHGLIDSGFAILSKDIVMSEIKTKRKGKT